MRNSVRQASGGPVLRFILLLFISILSLAVSAFALYVSYSASSSLSDVPFTSEPSNLELAIKNDLYRNTFDIFLAVLAAVSAIFAILGVGIYAALRGALESRVTSVIQSSIKDWQRLMQAWNLSENGYIWAVIYDVRLQADLSTDLISPTAKDREDALHYVNSSLMAAKEGMKALSQASDAARRKKSNQSEIIKLECHLLNLLVYGECAKFILEKRSDFDHLDDILLIANELYTQSIDQDLVDYGYTWYEAHETVGFFKIHVGKGLDRPDLVEEGTAIINRLVNRKRLKYFLEPPPKDWCDATRTEYQANGIELD